MRRKRTLITAALPYANGPLHLGHMVEYVQADIYSRFLKLSGHEAVFVCADDTHGTPIEINAAKQGTTPEAFIARYYQEHTRDFDDFLIRFDSYSTTNSTENREYSDHFFGALKERGCIYEQDVEQTFCEKCQRFLPDRYVKGTCPRCRAADQYGDQCEKCNAAYKTTDLLSPYCSICGSKPARKTSRHYFFRLSAFSSKLEQWLAQNGNLQDEVRNFVLHWIRDGLHDWDITRDGPYFGFTIVGEKDKYYYVWFDAPIGYIASTASYCRAAGKKVDDYWKSSDSSVVHFIGKDITYHHFLFWPAMLMGAGFSLPDDIVVHGHLTVNGEKMSKSRGTFITARQYLDMQPPEFLRFYYAANLARVMSDFDLDEDDFRSKVNNDLISNLANFVYRVLSFANNNFDSKLGKFNEPKELIAEYEKKIASVKECYAACNYREAVRVILEISAAGNKYFQEHEPWQMVRRDRKRCHEVVTFAANIAKNIAFLIAPILPSFALRVTKQLGLERPDLRRTGFDLQNVGIDKARIIFAKMEGVALPLKPQKEFPLDLRVASIEGVEEHPDAEKLYVLQVNLGREKRQLVAGLRSYYLKDELLGKHVIVVANLKPAKLRDVESQGMLLAADDGTTVKILQAPLSKPGDAVVLGALASNTKQITYAQFSKVAMSVKAGKAVANGKILKTTAEDVSVDIADGAKIR